MHDRLETLAQITEVVWERLADAAQLRGANAAESEWRSGVLATTGPHGADARHVVLREVDAAERRLVFYTDDRSPKVAQVEADGRGVIVFWSRAFGWQLRLGVRLAVETSGLAVSSRWARLQSSAAAGDYLSLRAPGSPISGPAGDLGTRSHFAIIVAQAETMDWLELHPDGHRRAIFDGSGARWVQP